MRFPRRAARRSAQCAQRRRARRCGCANRSTPLESASCGPRAGPTLVMWPRWRRSPELSSRGTSPSAATDVPGTRKARDVIERRAIGQRDDRARRPAPFASRPRSGRRAACAVSARVVVAMSGVSAASASSSGVTTARSGAGSVEVSHAIVHRRTAARSGHAQPLLPQQRPQVRDQPGAHPHQLPAHRELLAQRALRARDAMRAPKPAAAIRLGQRRRHRARSVLTRRWQRPIHRPVIRIRHDHLVAGGLERLRHPLAFRARLDENPHRPMPGERRARDAPARHARADRAAPCPPHRRCRIWLNRLCRSMAP